MIKLNFLKLPKFFDGKAELSFLTFISLMPIPMFLERTPNKYMTEKHKNGLPNRALKKSKY
jgi:hypothetical protein